MSQAPSTSSNPPSTSEQPPLDAVKGSFVRVTIVVIWLLIAFMIALLGYQWMRTSNPNAVLIVQGTDEHDGLSVRVEGASLKDPYIVLLGADNRYTAQFHLDAGTYRIRVARTGDINSSTPAV